jgi:hypothetical protein
MNAKEWRRHFKEDNPAVIRHLTSHDLRELIRHVVKHDRLHRRFGRGLVFSVKVTTHYLASLIAGFIG